MIIKQSTNNGSVLLYSHTEDYNSIEIRMYKKGNIHVSWHKLNKKYYKNLSSKHYYLNIINYKNIMKKLKSNGCAICGYNKYDGALDFHHVNPNNKKFNLSINALSLSNKRIINELNKCILLCSNCHREIHHTI